LIIPNLLLPFKAGIGTKRASWEQRELLRGVVTYAAGNRLLPQHYAQSRSFFFSIEGERENHFFQMNRTQEGDKLESQTFFHSKALGPKKIKSL